MTKPNQTTQTAPPPVPGAPLIYGRLADIMAKVTPISKGRRNQEQGYAYRGIDDIYNELHGHFAEARVFVTCSVASLERFTRTTQRGSVLNVTVGQYFVRFTAEDGSFVELLVAGEAQDSGDKATNKAASAALKYALMQTLLIPTAEVKDSEADDPGAAAQVAAPPRPPRAQREEPPAAPAASAAPVPPAPTPEVQPATPAPLPPATDEEVSRCVAAILQTTDPSGPWDALRERRTLTRAQNDRLVAAARESLGAAADAELADRPPLPTPQTSRSRGPKSKLF